LFDWPDIGLSVMVLFVVQHFSELEGNAQFKGQLRELYLTGAKVRQDIADERTSDERVDLAC
jgi:hypothetical protein